MSIATRARPRGRFAMPMNNPYTTKAHLIAKAWAYWPLSGSFDRQPTLAVDAECGEVVHGFYGARTLLELPDFYQLCEKCTFADFVPPYMVYRLYDAAGDLLYVGQTGDFLVRIRGHFQQSRWWSEVDRWFLEPHQTMQSSIDAEIEAIQNEHPRHNRLHRAQAA